jgi:transcriptional regulator with XRE-family HTH domain
MHIGLNIKRLRKQRGLTQDKLAELSGLSRITITNLETEPKSNPGKDTIERIAMALGVTSSELSATDAERGGSQENSGTSNVTYELAQHHLDFMKTNYLAANEEEKKKILEAIRQIYPGNLGDVFVDYCTKS